MGTVGTLGTGVFLYRVNVFQPVFEIRL